MFITIKIGNPLTITNYKIFKKRRVSKMPNQNEEKRYSEDPNTTQEQPSKIEEIEKEKKTIKMDKKMETTKKIRSVQKKTVACVDNY